MRKLFGSTLAVILSLLLAAPASALVLTFEGLQNFEDILDFYNGGTGSLGSSGPNYGVSFGSGALGLIDADAGGTGNFANEPTGDTVAFWLSGGGLTMNIAAGFTGGFSFYYTSSVDATVTVYDGLNSSGNVLGVINLGVNWKNNNCTGDPNGDWCHWDPIGVAFAGTAMSVDFSGGADATGYDNITFGSDRPDPGNVPEPATLALLGLGLLGFQFARRRKV